MSRRSKPMERMMNRMFLLGGAAAMMGLASLFTPTLAGASGSESQVGTPPGQVPAPALTDDEIRARLATEGYAVRRLERERGKIEVKAIRDGRTWELYIDPVDGRILKIEEDR